MKRFVFLLIAASLLSGCVTRPLVDIDVRGLTAPYTIHDDGDTHKEHANEDTGKASHSNKNDIEEDDD